MGKHAFHYLVGNLLVRAGSVLLLPLYTRSFSPAEYGTLEILSRVTEILTICLFVNGTRLASMTFYRQSDAGLRRQQVVGTSIAFGLASVLVVGLMSLFLAGTVSRYLPGASSNLIRLAILSVLCDALVVIPLAFVQAREESQFYAVVINLQFVLRFSLIFVLVRFLNWGVAAVFVASIVTSVITAIVLISREISTSGLLVDQMLFRQMALFALPFLPAGFCGLLLHSGDQFFLLRSAGAWELGIYALGYKLATMVSMLTRTPLYMIWSARMHDVAKLPDYSVRFARVFSIIVAAYLFVGLGFCLFQNEALRLLGESRYEGASAYIVPLVVAYLLVTAADLMDAAFYIHRRTKMKSLLTALSTVVMIALYALLIPRQGGVGAALATLLGFAFHAGVTFVVSQRLFRVDYEWRRLATMFVLAGVLWLLSNAVGSSSIWSPLTKLLLWLMWPAILWVSGSFTKDEKTQAIAILKLAMEKFAGCFFAPRVKEEVR